MKLELHPEARENFNQKIENLLTQLRFKPKPKIVKQPRINPNVYVSGHFDETNIIGEIKFSLTDSEGNVTGRMFSVRRKEIGLFDEDYKNLHRIAENIQRSMNPKFVISVDLLSELVFEWVKLKYLGKTKENAIEFILEESEKHIEEAEIWIPIQHLHLESPFVLGKVTFQVITKKFMDDYEESSLSRCKSEKDIEGIKYYFNRKRSEIQNRAVAIMKINAEPEQAYKLAYEELERTMNILRFFSPVNLFPNKTCYSAPIEKQHIDGDVFLIVKDGKVIKDFSGVSDKSNPDWNLSKKSLEEYFKTGLNCLSELLKKEKLNDFQQKLLEALYLYSRASLSKELSDRLVYTLVALETVFVKDKKEPLQDNISLRMAQMHPVSVKERKAIIDNVRDTYAIRSDFIHHGKNISDDDLETLKTFMWNTWMSIQALFQIAEKDLTRTDFFEWLDNRRIAG